MPFVQLKKHIKSNRLHLDAIVDLHGETEVKAYELIKNFVKDC